MASKKISPITGELVLNANKWTSGLKQAEKDTKALQSALRPMTDFAKSAGVAMTGAGLAITGALGAAAKVAANYGDSIGEAAAKTGLTTQELSRLGYAAQQNDASFETLANGLKFLSKNLVEAATGGKDQERAFAALGIETRSLTGGVRPLNDVLLEAADVFAGLPDGPEKAAVAMKIFGKSGADLIPMLNQGRDGLREWGDEAQKLGVVIDQTTADIGDEFNQSLDRAKTASLGLAVSVGNALLPAMTDLVNKGNSAVAWASSMAREFPAVTQGAAGLGIALAGGGGVLLGLATLGTLAPKVASGLDLIGGKAGLAKASLIALAVGGIALAEREMRKLEATGTSLGQGGFWQTMKEGAIGLAGPIYAARLAILSLRDAWDVFNNRSRQVDESLAGLNKRLTEGGPIAAAAAAENARLGGATTALDADMRKLLASLDRTTDSATTQKDAIAELKKQFEASLKPADDLEKTIKTLQGSFSDAAIVKVYGDQIIEATKKQKDHGFEIDANIARLNAMALGAKAVNRELELVRGNIPTQLPRGPIELARADIPEELGETGNVMAELGRKSIAAGEQIKRTEDRIRQLSNAGMSNAQIMEEIGDEIDQAVRNAQKMGHPLGRMTDQIARQAEATAKSAKRAKELGDAWANSVRTLNSNITGITVDALFDRGGKLKKNQGELNRLAKEFGIEQRRVNETVGEYYDRVKQASKGNAEFDEMFKHLDGGESFFSKLGQLAKDTSKDMLKSMLDGFISPFTDKLTGLAQRGGEALANLVFGGGGSGGGGQQGGGLLGGLLGGGGILGGLFGGGQRSQSDQIGILAGMQLPNFPGTGGGGGIGGGFGGGAAGSQSLLSSLGGLGGIADAANVVIGQVNRIGAGRRAADDFVHLQNAFGGALAGILSSGSGNAIKRDLVEQLWEEFQSQAATFAAGSAVNQQAVNQGFGTLTPLITQIRTDLGPGTTAAGTPAGTVNVDAPLTLNINIDGSNITAMEVRDIIAPELTTMLETGIRGIRERWAQLLNVQTPSTATSTGM